MTVDASARRMLTLLAVLLPIGVVFSIWRGDTLTATVGYVLVGVGVVGSLIGYHLYAGRQDR